MAREMSKGSPRYRIVSKAQACTAGWANDSHPWLLVDTWCLRQDHALGELDAAYTDRWWCRVPDAQYSGLEGCHVRPSRGVIGIVDTGDGGLTSAGNSQQDHRRTSGHGFGGHQVQGTCTQLRAGPGRSQLRGGFASTMWVRNGTYIHLRASGYTLAAVWITLRSTMTSCLGSSANDLSVSRTKRDSVSFCERATAGVAKASDKNSAPHRRNSTWADGPIIGRVAWTTVE